MRLCPAVLLAALLLSSCTARRQASVAAPPAPGNPGVSHAAPASAGQAANGGSLAKGGAATSGSVPSSEASRAASGHNGGNATALAENAGPRSGGAAASGSQSATAGGSQAYVSFASGEVVAAGASAPNPGGGSSAASTRSTRTVRVADPVIAGETLATGGSSFANVSIGNSYVVSLGHNTAVRFDRIGRAPAGSANSEPFRMVLSLRRGSIVVRAGADPPQVPLLLEVTTPHLFLSSRGGTLLISDTGDAARCAVGPGSAWLLPRSVVYSDMIEKVAKPAVALLNGILAKAVPLPRDSEITVLPAKLASIDALGSAIRQILTDSEGKKELPRSTMEALTGLARKAAVSVPTAIGKPQVISSALRKELDPRSIPKQTMKVTSTTENGKPVGESSAGSHTSRSTPATASGVQNGGAPAAGAGTAEPAAATRSSAQRPGPSPVPVAGAAPDTAASGGFPGPTPPTPPTPPTAP